MSTSDVAGKIDLDQLRASLTVRPAAAGLLEGIDQIVAWQIPLTIPFRGLTRRDGVLLHGPAGWGEVAPFWDYDAATAARWLASGLETAIGRSLLGAVPTTSALRESIPVNATIPEVGPERAHALVAVSGSTTAKVKVGGRPNTLRQDFARLEAVRDALGPNGHVRIDVNGIWSLDDAREQLPLMDRAAGGLEYAEQPCAQVEDLAALRREVDIPIAVDESIRLAADPLQVVRQEAADVAVLKVAPLGGVSAALRLAEQLGLPAVVSSALDTSVGLGEGARLASLLPELPHACGLGTGRLLERDLAVPPVLPVSGTLPVRPVRVSRTMLRGIHADAELTTRWQTRLGHMLQALQAHLENEGLV